MKSQVRTVNDHGRIYQALMFKCPACGLHMLPISGDTDKPMWTFNGDTESPTLSPSILTRYARDQICHSFLRDGVFEFLSDCTHSMAGQNILIPELPDRYGE